MKSKFNLLLLIDGLVNLLLGILLLFFPLGIGTLFGVPQPALAFYPTILGGVLLGIGIALLLEYSNIIIDFNGLGIGGAIAINFCGAGVLVLWLIFGKLHLPLRGTLILWLIAVLVIGIGICEVIARPWRQE
jgi:hypothetical protein